LKALLFFHPAVWWIENKLALEREMACDDAVLAETANPKGYARCLISVAEKSFMRRGLALAQAAVNRVRQTSLRVSQILDVNRSSATHVWKPALYSVAAFFIACLVSLSHAPELVAFKDQAPEAMALATTAGTTLASATELNSYAKPAVVTPASFRVRSDESRIHQIREGNALAVPQSDIGPYAGSAASEGSNPAAQRRYVKARHGSAGKQTGEDKSPAGTALADAASGSGAGRNSAKVLEARFVQSGPLAGAQIDEQAIAPKAVFLIMQTAQYDESGPTVWTICVWRVTVVDSTRNQIPAKKI
jgi:hypothetical protein